MVPSHTLPRLRLGGPSGRELLSFRYMDGLCFGKFQLVTIGVVRTKSWPGGPRPTLQRWRLVPRTAARRRMPPSTCDVR